MSLNNFLDRNGLNYLWSKVVSRISSSESSITSKIPIASDDLPKDLGPSSPGVSSKFSRSDHVHKVPDDIVSYTDAQTGVEETTKINALIDRKTGKTIYPQTIARAIYDSYGKDLQTRLDELNQNYIATSPQTLTDEQKTQARGNINAAPGGFGWGEAMKDVLASDAEDTYETYCGKLDVLLADMPDGTSQRIYARGPSSTDQYYGAGNVVAVLSKILGMSASLIGLSPDPRGTTNGLWRMLKDNGKWQPVEWINPPMELGTDYRTTERYLSKPVYVKTINMGNLPGNAVKQASFQSNNVVDKIVSVTGQCTSDSGVNMSLPYHAGSGPNWNTVILIGATGAGTAQIVTFSEDFAGYTDAYITVKYTKLAD